MSTHALVREYLAEVKHPVQLVKHFDEVPTNKIQYPIIAQIKYDGIYVLVVVVNSIVQLYSRTGKPLYFENAHVVFDGITELPDGVYIGELCNAEFTLEELAGIVNPNRKAAWGDTVYDKMLFGTKVYFHDYLTVDELLGGASDHGYKKRLTALDHRLQGTDLYECEVGSYVLHSVEHVVDFRDRVIAKGHEGIVLKQDLDWVAGHKGYRVMKMVKGISLDLLCVGVQYGKGKREGLIAALTFKLGEGTFNADLGKGWTDERRKALTKAHEAAEPTHVLGYDPLGDGAVASITTGAIEYPPIGKVYELKALQMSSTGKAMRLPKVVRVRDDKVEPDTL